MAIMNTYGDPQLDVVRGEGIFLYDSDGKQYIDGLSGIAVTGLGHSNKPLLQAIESQVKTLIHASNLYGFNSQRKLADKLVSISEMDNVFFCNSGTEANEAAIKIARKFGDKKGIKAPIIITAVNAFHGRSLANISASGRSKYRDGFGQRVDGFVNVAFNDLDKINDKADDDVVAVMLEPIQGEAGIVIPNSDYLVKLRQLCDDKGWLLILDEVQTGNARTGKYFAYQHAGILPDVITTAKGLGNGIPIGACLARGVASQLLHPGDHGSTFGGNPVAASAAITVIDEIEKNRLADNASQKGEYILQQLRQRLEGNQKVKNIRGLGLMIAVELDGDFSYLLKKTQAEGLLINVIDKCIVRLLPPLILSTDEAKRICDILCNAIFEGV